MNYGELFGGFVGNGLVAPFLGTCGGWSRRVSCEIKEKCRFLGRRNFCFLMETCQVARWSSWKKTILQNRLWILCFRDFSRIYLADVCKGSWFRGENSDAFSVVFFFWDVSWKRVLKRRGLGLVFAVWGGWNGCHVCWGVMVWWRAWALPVWEP